MVTTDLLLEMVLMWEGGWTENVLPAAQLEVHIQMKKTSGCYVPQILLVTQASWDPDFQDHCFLFPNDVEQLKQMTCHMFCGGYLVACAPSSGMKLCRISLGWSRLGPFGSSCILQESSCLTLSISSSLSEIYNTVRELCNQSKVLVTHEL